MSKKLILKIRRVTLKWLFFILSSGNKYFLLKQKLLTVEVKCYARKS